MSKSLENILSRVLDKNNENNQLMLETSVKKFTDTMNASTEAVMKGIGEATTNLVSGFNSISAC